MSEDKITACLEDLERLFRRYYKTFERIGECETDQQKLDRISVLEQARIYLLYPDHPFCQDKERKRYVGEDLRKFYRFSSRDE